MIALKAVLILIPAFVKSHHTRNFFFCALHMLAVEGMFIEPVAKKSRSFETSPCMGVSKCR